MLRNLQVAEIVNKLIIMYNSMLPVLFSRYFSEKAQCVSMINIKNMCDTHAMHMTGIKKFTNQLVSQHVKSPKLQCFIYANILSPLLMCIMISHYDYIPVSENTKLFQVYCIFYDNFGWITYKHCDSDRNVNFQHKIIQTLQIT